MNLSIINCLNECIEDDECKKYLIDRLIDDLIQSTRERIESCLDRS